MLRFTAISSLMLILSAHSWANDPCTSSERKSAGCNGPEVCMATQLEGPKGAVRFPQCVVQVSESITATNCFKTFTSRDNKEKPWVICSLDWDGPITQGSVAGALNVIEKTNAKSVWLKMSSEGGDVHAALRLGRKLRQHTATVQVRYCASACVLVLAGAISRLVHVPLQERGRIVIHRPYSLDVNEANIERLQAKYDQLNIEIADYLAEMNVPVSLLDAMLVIPPHRGRTLTREEVKMYHLEGTDAVYEQQMNARRAKSLGVSMTEYLRRRAVEENCWDQHYNSGKSDYPHYCSEAITTGQIGVDEAEPRN